MANDNKTIGRFELADIPPAPRGVPQIEVTFDIDANGILNVGAKDLGTGKEQSIRITASSGLSEDEIDKMVRDAESHAEEDRKFRELVDVRNQADGLIHAAEKTLKDLGDKATSEERMNIENAVSDLKAVLDKDDKEAIEKKTAALAEASGALAQKLYTEQQAGSAEEGQAASGDDDAAEGADAAAAEADTPWTSFRRVSHDVPEPPAEIRPHPHGVELGTLMQMLKDTHARTLRAALAQDTRRPGTRHPQRRFHLHPHARCHEPCLEHREMRGVAGGRLVRRFPGIPPRRGHLDRAQ